LENNGKMRVGEAQVYGFAAGLFIAYSPSFAGLSNLIGFASMLVGVVGFLLGWRLKGPSGGFLRGLFLEIDRREVLRNTVLSTANTIARGNSGIRPSTL